MIQDDKISGQHRLTLYIYKYLYLYLLYKYRYSSSLNPACCSGTHIYAPTGISLVRWPAFPGDDPKVNTTAYALDTIKSIWLLTFAAPAFVGTVTSSMSRLVYQLRIAFGQEELLDEWTVDQDARHPPGWFADP